MSQNINALKPYIKKLFDDIRSHVLDIENKPKQKERVMKEICDYVMQKITAESKSMLSSFYSSLIDDTLSQEPFLNNTKNKNKFYRRDIMSLIFEKYNFSTGKDIDYKQAYDKYYSLPISFGTAGIGIILSIALSKIIIIPVSLIVAGSLYYFISEQEKKKNKDKYKISIELYLDSIESEILVWFENIEAFYNKQVEELKSNLKDENNE